MNRPWFVCTDCGSLSWLEDMALVLERALDHSDIFDHEVQVHRADGIRTLVCSPA